MKTYILLTNKVWHDELFLNLKTRKDEIWIRLTKVEEFTIENLVAIQPNKIFIPHWSNIIASDIFNAFECIVFHMTDLPFGRGGSPLQNLILNGYNATKISALRVEEGIDSGPIYLKKGLSLEGNAMEIFQRSSPIILEMIIEIIDQNLTPNQQTGSPLIFKRRKPEQSNIKDLEDIQQLYNQIRMLDCEGYPNAFFETENFKIEFYNADLNSPTELKANVRITKK